MKARSFVLLVVAVSWILGCSSEPAEISVTLADSDATSFELVNASSQEWSEVEVTLQQLRPDGIEAACESRQLPSWRPGEAHRFPQCGGEKTLITITTQGQRAAYAFAEGKLYRKFGRREIQVT